MKSTLASLATATLAMLSTPLASAQTADDATGMLKALVAQAKSQGVPKTVDAVNGGTDAGKCKDKQGIGCMIATRGAVVVANSKNLKMVGQEFPADFADIDGTPIVSQVIGPFKSGKTAWEAKYKFAPVGTTKAVMQHSFCEKLDATHLACVTLQNVK